MTTVEVDIAGGTDRRDPAGAVMAQAVGARVAGTESQPAAGVVIKVGTIARAGRWFWRTRATTSARRPGLHA